MQRPPSGRHNPGQSSMVKLAGGGRFAGPRMRSIRLLAAAAAAGGLLAVVACGPSAEARNPQSDSRSQGRPYELDGTQVFDLPAPDLGRDYQIFVSLPEGYATSDRAYPVLYVTDADYAFPLIRSIARRVGDGGDGLEDFILVGLSYAVGDSPTVSRRRDYTPTPRGPRQDVERHGEAPGYARYVETTVIPFVERAFRADPDRRIFMGHSYGALLGVQILFTRPTLFDGYILGSPSLWYDSRHMMTVEQRYAETHDDLPANIFLYIGEYETPHPGDPRYGTADMVGDNAAFERALRSRGYPGLKIASSVVRDEDHLSVMPSGLTRGLKHLLPPRRAPR